MYKALFFAGRETGLSKEEVTGYRKKYGAEFEKIGFDVNDPTIGKDIGNRPLEEVLKEDDKFQDKSHITVAYLPELPHVSEATLRELKRAKEKKQLVYGFTDKGNAPAPEFVPYLDAWFTDFSELLEVLSIFIEPIGRYFTLAHTNNIAGDVFIYGTDISEVAPHHLHSLLKRSKTRKNIFYFCCETSHINDFAQKLPTILRLGKVESMYILTKDGTPHDIQMHTLTDEVVENQAFQGNVFHYVVEKGRLIEASIQAVKASRHLSQIEPLVPFSELIGVVRRLRSEGGCPNDQKETEMSVAEHLIEESGETKEAIDDVEHLKEELGDVLYNIFLMGGIKDEKQQFDASGIACSAVRKMIDKHPNVFSKKH